MANRTTPFATAITLRIESVTSQPLLIIHAFGLAIVNTKFWIFNQTLPISNPMQNYDKKSSPAILGCFGGVYYNGILMEWDFHPEKITMRYNDCNQK